MTQLGTCDYTEELHTKDEGGDVCFNWQPEADTDSFSVTGLPNFKYKVENGRAFRVEETRVTDPATGGQKGAKPEKYSMIPAWPLSEIARVYGFGANKYERDNWRKGYAWSLSLDALMRHIELFRSGVSEDNETGYHHLAHAAFHLNTLMEFERLGLGTDDRGDKP